MKFLERFQQNRVVPSDQAVRHRADEILEVTAINRLEILGSERRVTEEGLVQYRPVDGEWITVGKIRPNGIG